MCFWQTKWSGKFFSSPVCDCAVVSMRSSLLFSSSLVLSRWSVYMQNRGPFIKEYFVYASQGKTNTSTKPWHCLRLPREPEEAAALPPANFSQSLMYLVLIICNDITSILARLSNIVVYMHVVWWWLRQQRQGQREWDWARSKKTGPNKIESMECVYCEARNQQQ